MQVVRRIVGGDESAIDGNGLAFINGEVREGDGILLDPVTDDGVAGITPKLRDAEFVGLVWRGTRAAFAATETLLEARSATAHDIRIQAQGRSPFIQWRSPAGYSAANRGTGRKEMAIQANTAYREQVVNAKWQGALVVTAGASVEAKWGGAGEWLEQSASSGDGFVANFYALLAGADKTLDGARIFRLEVGGNSLEISVTNGYADVRENGVKVTGLTLPRVAVKTTAPAETMNFAFGAIREGAKLRAYFSVNGLQLSRRGVPLSADYDFSQAVAFRIRRSDGGERRAGDEHFRCQGGGAFRLPTQGQHLRAFPRHSGRERDPSPLWLAGHFPKERNGREPDIRRRADCGAEQRGCGELF